MALHRTIALTASTLEDRRARTAGRFLGRQRLGPQCGPYKSNAIALAILLFLLCGCATEGKRFNTLGTRSITVGKTTYDELRAQYGEPFSESDQVMNTANVKRTTYHFSKPWKHGDIIPSQNLVFESYNGLVVGYQYDSNFTRDQTDFDDSKLSLIRKDETTEDQAIHILGKPSGRAVYPVTPDPNLHSITYSYSQIWSGQDFHKKATILIDSSGVVTSANFSSRGTPVPHPDKE